MTEEAQTHDPIVVSIHTMRKSNGTDFYVAITCGGREVTPHVFDERYKAAYHVALYQWLFGQGPEPDLMAFKPGDDT